MKTLKIITVLVLCFTINTNAQFLEKLAKKAQEKVERNAEERAQRRIDKKIDKTFDGAENEIDKKTKKKTSPAIFSKAKPSENYTFSHKYVMQINDGKHDTTINYFLNNEGNYIGSSIPDKKNSNMMTVIDISKETIFMFMETKGDKTMMSMGLNFEEVTNEAIDNSNVQITATGNTKTILTYPCKEYKVKGTDFYGTVWVTESAGILFAKSFYKAKTKKGINQSWMATINGLTLETNITDTSKRKPKTIQMKCIALEKSNMSINSSSYKKLM